MCAFGKMYSSHTEKVEGTKVEGDWELLVIWEMSRAAFIILFVQINSLGQETL